jgi:hypothetical protein
MANFILAEVAMVNFDFGESLQDIRKGRNKK